MRRRRKTGQQMEKNKHQPVAWGETGLPDPIITINSINKPESKKRFKGGLECSLVSFMFS